VKCIRQTTNNRVEDVQGEVVKEASAMSCLNHPNLIQLYGVLITSPIMLVRINFTLMILINRIKSTFRSKINPLSAIVELAKHAGF